eukprot:scaffold363_cov209-Alexandrium_tamarense.AAC.3
MKFHPPIVALIAVGSSSSFTAGFVILPSSHRSPWPHSSSSQLNYYKSDEPFAERLSRSISPELLNEINAAQKALVAQVKCELLHVSFEFSLFCSDNVLCIYTQHTDNYNPT